MKQTNTSPVATITENNISLYMDGVLYPPINKSNPNFQKIKDAIREKNWSVLPSLLDISKTVKKYLSKFNNVKLENGVLYYKNVELNNHISKRIMALLDEGFEFTPLLNFIENLHQNPSYRSVNELYSFLEHFALPITEDGHFLAYKAVRNDYKDIYSGKFDNSVGKTPSVDRNTVDENKDHHCSHGLHVGAITYVKQYGHFGDGEIAKTGNKLMIVKVNPADAVSVPGDHNCTKLRVCKYEVIGEISDIRNILDKAVYTSNGDNSDAKFDDSDLDSEIEDSEDIDQSDDCGCCNCGNCGCSEDDDQHDTDDDDEYHNGYVDGKKDFELGIPYECPDQSDEYNDGYVDGYDL